MNLSDQKLIFICIFGKHIFMTVPKNNLQKLLLKKAWIFPLLLTPFFNLQKHEHRQVLLLPFSLSLYYEMRQLVLSEIQGIFCHFLPRSLLVCFDFNAFMWLNSDAFLCKRWVLHNYGSLQAFSGVSAVLSKLTQMTKTKQMKGERSYLSVKQDIPTLYKWTHILRFS